MTCRVARFLQDPPRIDLVCCCECGSSNVAVGRTLNMLGPYLCQACTQSLVEYGASEQPRTRSPMRQQSVARGGGISGPMH